MVRIALQELLKSAACLVRLVEIVFVDLPDGEQRVKAIFARRIFAAKKFILLYGRAQETLVIELASHLNQEFDDESLRSEEHTSELQSRENLVCRLLLEKKKKTALTAD